MFWSKLRAGVWIIEKVNYVKKTQIKGQIGRPHSPRRASAINLSLSSFTLLEYCRIGDAMAGAVASLGETTALIKGIRCWLAINFTWLLF